MWIYTFSTLQSAPGAVMLSGVHTITVGTPAYGAARSRQAKPIQDLTRGAI